MIEFYDLLQKIKEKPGLYIGSPSITDLFMFLCGYKYSRQELVIPLSNQERDFQEFQPWLQERFAITTSASWAKIILLNSSDESNAFIAFFNLLDEFLNRPNTSTIVNKAEIGKVSNY